MHAWTPERKERIARVAIARRVTKRADEIAKQVTVERLPLHEPTAPAASASYAHLAARCNADALAERLYAIEKRREARA